MRKIYNFAIKYSIYGLVLFLPLFWLPWTVEVFEFNKQYLLFVLVSLALFAWLAKMIIVRKKVVFRRTPLDIWILLFMLFVILSAVFSIDSVSSWLGFYGRFSDSAIGLLAMCLMYFVVVNNCALRAVNSEQRTMNNGEGRGIRDGDEDEEIKVRPSERGVQEKSRSGLLSETLRNVSTRKARPYARGGCSPGISLGSIIDLVLVSGWVAVLTAYLSVFNLWSKIPGLPEIMNLRSFNTVSGSFEGLSVFLAALAGLLTGVFLQGKKRSVLAKIFSYGLLAAAVVLLVIINFWAAWVSLAVAMALLLIIAFWTRIFRKKVNLLMLPIALLIIAGIFLVNLPGRVELLSDFNTLNKDLPKELILDNATTNMITWQTLKEYPILGSGEGTFLANFAKFKPVEFNDSQFWNIRFDRASNYLMETVGALGILGVLGYLTVVFMFLLIMVLSLWRLKKSKTVQSDKLIILPFLLFWLILFVSQFVYSQNTVLLFYFWLFTALGIVSWQRGMGTGLRSGASDGRGKKMSFSFKKLPEVGLVINVVLLILVFAFAGMFYLGGRFYLAEMKSVQAVSDREELIKRAEEIVNLNRYRSNYRENLSQVYLISAWEEARKAEAPSDADDTTGQASRNIQLLQTLAAGSIQQARTATNLSPNSVNSWENLGAVYRDARGLVGGTLPFALEAYARAVELEPNNPFFYRELCRLNLIAGDEEEKENNWDEIVNYCQKAVDLKSNYLDAHIQLALVYEKKGDLEKALEQMESVLAKLKGVSFQRGSELAGAATEIYFQMGRLYFNLDRVNEAISVFEQAVIITPQYANGRYALALSYQMAERNADALIQFKIVNQLVPGNENIIAAIRQLEASAGEHEL